VADLQRRLDYGGFAVAPDDSAFYGPGTRAAVEAFQHRRGLRVDGVCGPQTWGALVEAGFRIGDRFLYLRRPMLRGDDVADLQYKLSALGFDSGRVDGILGEQTAGAIREFQRNAGLPVDGILGGATMRELKRVMPREAGQELVSTVRDKERLRRAPTTLQGRTVAIGEEGGLDAVVAAVRRRLAAEGASVVPLLHPTGSVQAASANTAGAEAYVGARGRCRQDRRHVGSRAPRDAYAGRHLRVRAGDKGGSAHRGNRGSRRLGPEDLDDHTVRLSLIRIPNNRMSDVECPCLDVTGPSRR
jgi:N-acetylmuramoyl-L-alanine amidase